LDPASSAAANAVVQATHYFSEVDDGLEQPWRGRVWLNPPYAQPAIEHFTRKLADGVAAGDVTAAIVLVNNATETEWFATVARVATAICFPVGRVRFWSPDRDSATPLQGQAVLYTGSDVAAFRASFGAFGLIASLLPPSEG
jgi:ParB family chromosome partitioning protein